MDHLTWLGWWRDGGRAALEAQLLAHWDPLDVRDDPARHAEYARTAMRLAGRLRNGAGAGHLADVLAAANRELGVRVNERQLWAVATEIEGWYRREGP
ncbi:hypothetical protein OJ997_09815 [Solirubrobacter phytolaccae]|uniref:Uncharacterized protein n=1 Tax=Solirubrobacter phytolaccae TaxID=1404360 RepID=A0A9X3S7Q2_9ACTN|nr:hypothetical protein [Solirubrobacter phytolaccae]MDA0180588.1 hypothetical protein [Solirubrobacter phytolaccae]